MLPNSWVVFVPGLFLLAMGFYSLISGALFGVIPIGIGLALVYLGYKGGRGPLVVFGHTCIVVGIFLVTWGIYLLPYARPSIVNVFTRPLFWGLFSIFGGICALFHGFCRCVRGLKREDLHG